MYGKSISGKNGKYINTMPQTIGSRPSSQIGLINGNSTIDFKGSFKFSNPNTMNTPMS